MSRNEMIDRGRLAALAFAGVGGLAAAAPGIAAAEDFTVDTLGDEVDFGDSETTLREAILSANGSGDPEDRILFTSGLTGTIELTSSMNAITGPVEIVGPGPGVLEIDGVGSYRQFEIADPGGLVSISGLKLQSGSFPGPGGSVLVTDGEVAVSDCEIRGSSGSEGGAIEATTAAVEVDSCVISAASADGNGGAISAEDSAITLTDTEITGSTALEGGAIWLYGSDLTVYGGEISGSTSTSSGGAIHARPNSSMELTGTTVSGNHTVSDSATGGGIFSNESLLTLTDSTLIGNYTLGDTAQGGAIFFRDYSGGRSLTVEGSTISGNSTQGTDSDGGAIRTTGHASSSLTITNSTLTSNYSSGSQGGAILSGANALTISSTTISGNAAGSQGGGVSASYGATIEDSIVSDNTAAFTPDIGGAANVSNSLIGHDDGFTLTDGGGNLIGLDPELGPLADNGGPTPTHLPGPASPVIDAAGSALGADQRGFARPVDVTSAADAPGSNGSDMGAVELREATAEIVSAPGELTNDPTPDFELELDLPGAALEYSVDGGPFASCDPAACAVGELEDGEHTITFKAISPDGIETTVDYALTIDTVVSDPDATAKKKQKQKGKKIKVKIKAGAQEAVDGLAQARVTVKGKKKSFDLGAVEKSTGAGEQTVYKLVPISKKDTKKIKKLLKKGKDLRANPSVELTDAAGNSVIEKRVVRLKAKKRKKKR